MGIVYMVENIPSNLPGLVGDLCVLITVVQPKYNLLLVSWFPFALQIDYDYYPSIMKYWDISYSKTGKVEMPHSAM